MSFQSAITDMDAAKARAEDEKARRRLRIEHIQRLERVLDSVEHHNLQRDRQVPPDMWRQLAELEVVLPVPSSSRRCGRLATPPACTMRCSTGKRISSTRSRRTASHTTTRTTTDLTA